MVQPASQTIGPASFAEPATLKWLQYKKIRMVHYLAPKMATNQWLAGMARNAYSCHVSQPKHIALATVSDLISHICTNAVPNVSTRPFSYQHQFPPITLVCKIGHSCQSFQQCFWSGSGVKYGKWTGIGVRLPNYTYIS